MLLVPPRVPRCFRFQIPLNYQRMIFHFLLKHSLNYRNPHCLSLSGPVKIFIDRESTYTITITHYLHIRIFNPIILSINYEIHRILNRLGQIFDAIAERNTSEKSKSYIPQELQIQENHLPASFLHRPNLFLDGWFGKGDFLDLNFVDQHLLLEHTPKWYEYLRIRVMLNYIL